MPSDKAFGDDSFQTFFAETGSGKQVPILVSSMTVGSRSTNTALGTCLPDPVSAKKVWKESSPKALSLGMQPSGWIPCSRQYSSQQALPIWQPAWPMWTEIHSRMLIKVK